MVLVADEGVDRAIVVALRAGGHEVLYVAEVAPSISDEEVLRLANHNRALLVTVDKDFGELVYRLGHIHGGVVLLRLFGVAADAKERIVVETIRVHGTEMVDAFTVITPGSVRIRSRR